MATAEHVIFYIDQKREKRNSAGAKAPDDISTLCARRGYTRFAIDAFPKDRTKLYQKLWLLTVCNGQWKKLFRTVKKGDVVIFQHPSYGKRIAIRWIKKIQREKGCKFIAVIHDLESLRGGIAGVIQANKKVNQIGDNELLKCFDAVICHNESMRQYMIGQGFDPDRLINLEIFDYLTDCTAAHDPADSSAPSIAIAGNLAIGKCGYIYKIQDETHNRHLAMNLFGINYDAQNATENMVWHGSFQPEELPAKLAGRFGLVWDGDSAETCSGNTGNYLRYNNPHKTSLYLASGLPVIVWKQAAIAGFVEQYQVGIAVDSLRSLEETIRAVSQEEYTELCENVEKLSAKLRSGFFFYRALDTALNRIQEGNA